jgi:hypothetical protein
MIRRRARLFLFGAVALLTTILSLFVFVTFMLSGANAIASSCGSLDPMSPQPALSAGASDPASLSSEQIGNARIIIEVGQNLGASKRDAKLTVWVAYHESSLRNLTYGTADSLGLFQQRPSQGWGTPEQILNPIYASRKFYEALFKVPNRDSLPYLDEALAVQHASRAAYLSPVHNFLNWEPIADAMISLAGIDLPDKATATTVDTQDEEPGFDTLCSSTTDIGVPGQVIIAPGANNPGEPIDPVTLGFLAQVAGIYGKPIICTTGTNHSYLTVDGNVSDHATGHACDFGMNANGGTDNGPVGDAIAAACLEAAGEFKAVAIGEAFLGGLFTREHNGLRTQCIWKTDEGGNHHNHVHIGAAPA